MSEPTQKKDKMKVVIVGSGIGGISAAYHCVKDGHEVVLLEKESTLGGHAHSISLDSDNVVDLGFMMYGDSNPNIKAWFRSLGLTKPNGTTKIRIPMSMSVASDVPGDLQFSSRRPFASWSDLFNVNIWRILIDIYRFTVDLMTMPSQSDLTTGEWAASCGYSQPFLRHYFFPFVAILWTIPKNDVLSLPVSQFLRCLTSHANSLYIPLWQVVLGALGRRVDRPKQLWWYLGSAYVTPILAYFEHHRDTITVRTSVTVTRVASGGQQVTLASGEIIHADVVILATHADTSASLLAAECPTAVAALKPYAFHQSMMYVHRDPSFLPNARNAWGSWNVKLDVNGDYIMTYWLNRIQRLTTPHDVFVTITPADYTGTTPSPASIVSQFPWDHPKLLVDCKPLKEVLDLEGIVLSGAWLGRGFHEDGFVAGRRAAAIVSDRAHMATRLYEDPGNLPVPPVPAFVMPLSVSLTLGAVGVLTLATMTAVLVNVLAK